MNVLPLDKQIAVISALTEGCSIRTTERLTSIHRDTIMRLAARVGFGAYFNRGNVFNKQGHFAEAIADYSRAIALDFKDANDAEISRITDRLEVLQSAIGRQAGDYGRPPNNGQQQSGHKK